MTDTALQTAAREALTTHNVLTAADGREPPLDSAGMPYHPDAWLHWYEDDYLPAYARWDAAMTALQTALGHRTSRHPFNFRPLCEEIIRGGSDNDTTR